jgi:FG-GAP-like repeat
VDIQATHMIFYDKSGRVIVTAPIEPVPLADKGLSFQGVSFHDGITRIAKVVIVLGNAPLSARNTDGQNAVDVVAMDDFIYGEPRALDHHSGDFDGDGAPDLSVFRPGTGEWFVLNSGSNTVDITRFGQIGDVPVNGDFDGDKINDIALYRQTTGTWFFLNSTNGKFNAINFGTAEDKPVPGDYDKDGRDDIAVWRPSIGDYFILRSSDEQFQEVHWGLRGDIPVISAPE